MNEFEKQMISMISEMMKNQTEQFLTLNVKINALDTKINNLDTKVNNLDSKLNTVMTQTADNTEFNTVVKLNHEQLENEIAEIKKRLEV